MASDLTPDQIRRAEFRAGFRGLDAGEVQQFLQRVADAVADLEEQNERLAARLGEYADRDLESEFDTLGREVTAVLQTAREAADSMRERASLDASRWRAESMAEAEAVRKDARNDAEALRGDAWTAGTELLNQSVAEANQLRKEAERDVLTIMGEAEREAHRLTSAARREAEDMARVATMGAEKTTSEAAKRRDEMIDQASRQAEAAQERTRALEERREELLEELENVRSTLGRLEGTLEERRDSLQLSAPTSSVKVIPTQAVVDPLSEEWKPGETVRIITPGGEQDDTDGGEPDDEPSAVEEPPVEVPPVEETAVEETASEKPVADETAAAPSLLTEPVATATAADEQEPAQSDDSGFEHEVDALFASLRGAPDSEQQSVPPPVADAPADTEPEADVDEDVADEELPVEDAEDPAVETTMSSDVDLMEERDALLLPVTNRALRGVKKAVTDAQNVALDSLRTNPEWLPDKGELADAMRADLIALWAESYAAGHQAAESMTGSKLKRPATPNSSAADEFGDALTFAVGEALAGAGDGQRERQSATSRVFRAWRTDEAERRIRELGLTGFHRGVVDSVGKDTGVAWVPAGNPCSACRQAAADPRNNLPPVHGGCECTIAV